MIPAAATVYVMLVQINAPEQPEAISLGALDALREGYAPMRLHTVSHVKLSAATAVVQREGVGVKGERRYEGRASVKIAEATSVVQSAAGSFFQIRCGNRTRSSLAEVPHRSACTVCGSAPAYVGRYVQEGK